RSRARVESQQITVEDVIRAGRTLFGPAFAIEAGVWRDALKATYRRRALETHPDRARALGRREADLVREFRAVADAYRVLSAVPAGRLPARAPARPAPRTAPPRPASRAAPAHGAEAGAARAAAPADPARAPTRPDAPRVRASVHPQDLPRRRLRFAEYLYYSGRVRWSELVEAIAWQRAQRPPIGRIAVELGYLAHDDVGVILERRRLAGANGIPFGEWAVRLGYLTPFQVLAILGQQLRSQRPIGQYFVERGLLGPDDIEAIRHRIVRHNVRFAG
ncbi:MAG TPA: J domain-containing protein, partial [Anaeromyxobacter sp.]|nr:J domain-containing protein [Anaeromyxobacter sp.]